MEKIKIKIIDTNFAHAKYSSDFQESKYIEWDRSNSDFSNNIVFITDNSLYRDSQIICKEKIGWLMEPRAMNQSIYEWISKNYDKFDRILTYDTELLKIDKKFQFYPHCMNWIKPEDHKIYDKTKLLSIIASNKIQCEGHRLRGDVVNRFRDKMDVYGRVYNPIDYKLTALKDYMFTIAIENSKQDYYFTEKIIDAFCCGTVPLYWGTNGIDKFFNPEGIITFDTLEDLQYEINSLDLDKYNSMLPAIKENFELSKKYLLAEDFIWENTDIFKEYKNK